MSLERATWLPLACILTAFGALDYANLGAYDLLVWDEAEYASIGRSLARGDGYAISGQPQWIRPPVTPAVIAAAILAFGEGSDAAAKALMPLLAIALLVLVYRAVTRLYGRSAGFSASAALAIAPEFATRAVMLLSEIPFLLLYTATLLAFFRAFRQDLRWFHAAWILLALSFLTRYTAVLFGPTLLLLLGYEALSGRANLQRILRTRTFWLAPCWALLITAPWLYWQWLLRGDPLACLKYASNQIPSYDLATMPWHFYLTSLPGAMTCPIAVAGGAGLAYAIWRNERLGVYAAISATVIVGWHSQYAFKEFRLVTAVLPLFAIGAGIAANAWLRRFAGRLAPLRRAFPAIVLAAALAMSAPRVLDTFQTRIALGEPSFLEAMAYVRRETAPDALLLSESYAQIHWYADRPVEGLSNDPAKLSQQLARADWLVVTNFERGQPEHVTRLGARVTMNDQLKGDVRVFRDARFVTALAKAEWARRRWDETVGLR